jgi:hypothetical protein
LRRKERQGRDRVKGRRFAMKTEEKTNLSNKEKKAHPEA